MATWNLSDTKHHILICNGGSCMRHQGEEVTKAIRNELAIQGADAQIHTTRTLCNGRCEDACVVIAYPEGIWYRKVTPELGRQIVKQHLLEGSPVEGQISYTYQDRFIRNGQASEGVSKEIPSNRR